MQATGTNKTRTKRSKPQQASETGEDPPAKKVRKAKAATVLPPTPLTPPKAVEPALLGSLPLYGEELPEGGYDSIPTAARSACAELRDVLCKIHDLKNGDIDTNRVGVI